MFVTVNGARLFFDTVGSQLAIDGERMAERPTLIVLHGGPGFDHTSLRPWFDRFADTHQVVFLDHRANGRSGGAVKDCTLVQWADDVKGLCDVLGIVKPVVYGNSFGGMVAMTYAGRHPDHPAKLILSSTEARLHLDETLDFMERLGGKEARDLCEKFWTVPDSQIVADYIRICLPLYNPPGPARPETLAARKRAIVREDILTYFCAGENHTMDARPLLARITCPTLVTTGEDDPITPASSSREIFESLSPGVGRLEIVKNAGHGIHRDKPELAEAMFREFLAG